MQNHQLHAELDKMAALLDAEHEDVVFWKRKFWALKRKELDDSKAH